MRFAALVALALTLLFQVPALRADGDEQRADQIFATYNKADSPGCALGVIRNGSFVYRKGYGAGSLELGVLLSSQSVFYIGSVSKQFTAVSIVLAAEQGFLSLDDNIRKYIPELPDYGQPITLRQMLYHTSWFRDVLGLLAISGRSATKKPLSAFAAENIFQPLGMTRTRFYDDHTLVMPGRVPAYDFGKNGSFLVDWSTNFDQVGDGGLMSSVDDLLLWDRNFYDNQLGKGMLLTEMQTPRDFE